MQTKSIKLSATKSAYTEEDLINGLINGDNQCFEFLVRNYGGKLLSTARRYLKNEDDAQDTTQEAYIKVFQNINSFKQGASLYTWLHRILVTTALMKLRTKKRQQKHHTESHEVQLSNSIKTESG